MSIQKFRVALLVILLFTSSVLVRAQDEDDDYFIDKDFDINVGFDFHGKPAISLLFGQGYISLFEMGSKIAKPNFGELRLGYLTEKSFFFSENLMKYKYSYASLSNISSKLGKTPAASEISMDAWQFGFGWDNGYGYRFGKSALIFYNANGLNWTRFRATDGLDNLVVKNLLPASDANALALFDSRFRFGTRTEAGVKLQIIPELILDASFERSAIFPRLLFWKAAGSYLIETTAQVLLGQFIEKVMDSSPVFGPIVNFVLKNGLSYAIYEFRKEKMNWPFKTAAPIFNDSFKMGMTFVF